MESIRTLIYYGNFFFDFYNLQSEKVREKIDFVLFVLTVSKRIPYKYFKHLTDTNGLYEIRIEYQGNIYRLFCCFDEGNIIVLFNGFQKKGQKTPSREIEKAKSLMKAYFEEKLSNK